MNSEDKPSTEDRPSNNGEKGDFSEIRTESSADIVIAER